MNFSLTLTILLNSGLGVKRLFYQLPIPNNIGANIMINTKALYTLTLLLILLQPAFPCCMVIQLLLITLDLVLNCWNWRYDWGKA